MATSAIERGIQLWRRDNEFEGDTWTVDEPLSRQGSVTTTVSNDAGTITIKAVATYPSDAEVARRAVRTFYLSNDAEKND